MGSHNGTAPPHDLRVEQAVLGAILLAGGGKVLDAVATEGLRPEHFYRHGYGATYAAMRAMHARRGGIDVATVAHELAARDQLDDVGGRASIDMLAGAVPDLGNHRAYARIVLDMAAARDRLRAAHEVIANPFDGDRAKHLADPAARGDVDSWRPVELASIVNGALSGEVVGPVPSLLPRADGPCLLYGGELHSFAAEPESGKSWIVQAEAARLIATGRDVLILDFEDSPVNVVARMIALGAAPDDLLARFVLVQPEGPLHDGAIAALTEGRDYALVVIDGVTEAMGLLGLEITSNDDVAAFRAQLGTRLRRTGAAVVEVDHVVKDREARGRFALGGGHKLAGVAVAYSVTAVERPSRTRAGVLKIKVEKDRHGHVRTHEDGAGVIALARIVPEDDGARVTLTLEPPDGADDAGAFRPTVLMRRVSEYLDAQPGATRNDVRRDVKGKNEALDTALRLLVQEGYIERRQEGQAQRHHSLKRFDEATGPPSPDRAPTEPGPGREGPSPRAPAPTGGPGSGPGSAATPAEPPRPRRLDEVEATREELDYADALLARDGDS